MRIGVVFPQTEFGNDPIALRDYAQTVEGLGFSHFLAYDHVLGADTSVRPGWSGPYTSQTPFHEIFVLFGYVAAVTERLELVSWCPDPAAAADGAGGEAGGIDRCPQQRPHAARRRRGLE